MILYKSYAFVWMIIVKNMEQIMLHVYLFLDLFNVRFCIEEIETYCKYKYRGEFFFWREG
jgi:hypothetical protein